MFVQELESITSEINNHSIECESLWHEEYDWPREKASYILDAFCNNCRVLVPNVMMGEVCLRYLERRGSNDFSCRRCRKSGSVVWSYVPI